MASKPQRDTQKGSADSERLPFEPNKSRKKADGKPPAAAKTTSSPKAQSSAKRASGDLPGTGIPEMVSRRMVRRMALFCGIPSALGMSTFITSYLAVTNGVYDVPTSAVLLVSLGFFGLGVVGLSYGVLSASWDENEPGSKLGWSEFTVNFGRMTGAWRSSGKKS